MFERSARPILDEFENWISSRLLDWGRENKIKWRGGSEHHPATRAWGRGLWITRANRRDGAIFVWRPTLEDVGFFGRRLWVKDNDGKIHILPYKIWEQGLTDVVRQYLLLQ